MTGRRRMLAWAAGLAAVEVAAAYLVYWAWFTLRTDVRGPDFIDYYTAARLELVAGPGRLYDLALQAQFQEAVSAGWGGHRLLLPYLLPPWSALATAPLGLLGYRAAYAVMGLVTIAALAATIALLLRSAAERGRRALLLAALAAAFLPGFVLLIQGQGDGLAVLAMALAARSWLRGHDGRAGALAALTLVKPQLVLLLPVMFLAHHSGRALAAYAATALLLFAATLPFFGLGGWHDYAALVLPGLGGRPPAFPLRAAPAFSLGGHLPGPVALLALGAGALLLLARRGDRRRDLALAITLSLFLAPYANAHDVILLLPALVLAAGMVPLAAAAAYLGGDAMLGLGPAAALTGMGLLAAGLLARRGLTSPPAPPPPPPPRSSG